MGKGWDRTPKQEAYLEGEFNNYLKARKDGEVKNWRAILHEKWEERWPERQVLINEWNLSDDTPFDEAQMTILGEALAARKTVKCIYISHWYLNSMSSLLATVQLHSLAHRCETHTHKKPSTLTLPLHPQVGKERLQEIQAEAYDSRTLQ